MNTFDSQAFPDSPVYVVCEGCADAIFGRMADKNPYAQDFEPYHSAYACGHAEGMHLLEIRGRKEATRWLGPDAA